MPQLLMVTDVFDRSNGGMEAFCVVGALGCMQASRMAYGVLVRPRVVGGPSPGWAKIFDPNEKVGDCVLSANEVADLITVNIKQVPGEGVAGVEIHIEFLEEERTVLSVIVPISAYGDTGDITYEWH